MASFTGDLELGTTVIIVPYRHPLLTARMVTNIDRLSGGRLVFGVGVGWSKPEFASLGVPFEERGKITDDYLEAIIEAWTSDVVTVDAHYLAYRKVSTGPRPMRRPQPPVWVGGASRSAIRRAVRFGDAWHPIDAELEWLRDKGLPALMEEAK
jgi:alkanesulfonate monooxygenase SsuD/methylene tetrahydromethanopterin reductase-like flavin-dependent oxidoreductase (luciferase family)